MRDPTRKKEKSVCFGKVGRIKDHRVSMKEIPGMIQGHNDHNQAPQEVNRLNALV